MALTTLPTLPDGHAPTGAEFAALLAAITELRPLDARKTGNQSVSSASTGTTLVDDAELFVTVAASARYEVRCYIKYTASTTGDIKVGWSGPSGATFDWNIGGPASGAVDATSNPYFGANTIGGTDVAGGTGSDLLIRPAGILVTSTTAGTFRFRFAQGTSNATNTTIYAGSEMILRRLA